MWLSAGSYITAHTSIRDDLFSYITFNSFQDITLRLSSLAPNVPRGTPTYPSTRYTLAQPGANCTTPDLTLQPLLDLANHLNACLDIIDVTRWTGPTTSAPFISSQLRLLSEHVSACRACLKDGGKNSGSPEMIGRDERTIEDNHNLIPERRTVPGPIPEGDDAWWSNSVPASAAQPPLHPHLSLHFTIRDACLVLTIRTVSPVTNQSSMRPASRRSTPAGSRAGSKARAPAAAETSSSSSTTAGTAGGQANSSLTATNTNTNTNNANTNTSSEFSLTGFNLRDRLFSLGHGQSSRHASQADAAEIFTWRRETVEIGGDESSNNSNGSTAAAATPLNSSGGGNSDANDHHHTSVTIDHVPVQVREKVRVESGDPNLISVAAKLSALDHELRRCRYNLRIVMGEDEEGEGDGEDGDG